MEKGKFIVFEGIEGSGKTKQVQMLFDYLSKKVPTHKTREASDGPIGKLLREVYLSGKRKVDSRIINLLYVPDRLDHITNGEDGMLKMINEGITVISDRYYLSSAACHSSLFFDDNATRLQAMVDIIDANKINLELLKPDVIIYIDTAPEEAAKRMKEREGENSIFDNIEYMKKQHICYDTSIGYVQTNFGENVIRIDGNRTPEEVHADIVEEINKLFNFN